MKPITLLNSFSGVAQVLVNTGLLLVIIPLFIQTLGFPLYSIYSLITAIGSVTLFTNFGFNTSLIKYLAEQTDREESDLDIVVTLIIVGGSSLLVALVLLACTDFMLTHVLDLPGDIQTSSVRFLYFTTLGANVFQIIGQIPAAVLDSKHRVYISNGVQLGMGILSKGTIIVFLLVAPSLEVIGWILLISSLCGACAMAYFASSTWGPLRYSGLPQRFTSVARKHFAYGRGIYGSMLMGFIYEPMTKVLISRFIGLIEVGYFDIAFRIKSFVWNIFERLLYPVLPLIASSPEVSEVRRVVEEVERKLLILVVPAIVTTLFLAQPIVQLWIGSELWPVSISIVAIVVSYLIALLFIPLYYVLMVKNHQGKTFTIQSVNVGVNLFLFACLVPHFGYYGALTAFCLAVCVTTLLCGWYQWKILHSKPYASKKYWGKVYVLGGSLVGLNLIMGYGGPNDALTRVIMVLVMNTLASSIFFRWLKLITREDVQRYIGRDSRVGLVLERLLVRGT